MVRIQSECGPEKRIKTRKKNIIGSSHPQVFCKKDVLKTFAKFTGTHLCQSLFFNKIAGLHLGFRSQSVIFYVTIKPNYADLLLGGIKRGYHCLKNVRVQIFPGPYFPAFVLNMERYPDDTLRDTLNFVDTLSDQKVIRQFDVLQIHFVGVQKNMKNAAQFLNQRKIQAILNMNFSNVEYE